MALPFNSPPTQPDPVGDLAFLQAALPKEENQVTKKLALHINKVWVQNQQDNKAVRLEW